ncbi:MAG: AgmX/PglI C-terminal domain-containing protein [Polyangiales bacterium]
MRAASVVSLIVLAATLGAEAQPRRRPRRPRRRAAAVEAVLPPTHGRIAPEAAQGVLATRNEQVRTCYNTALRTAPGVIRGEITVRLRVEDDGHVSRTSASGESSLTGLARCIEGALRTLRFPAPEGRGDGDGALRVRAGG